MRTDKKKATELQIQIDDVYACLGQCAGCVLAADERQVSNPDMSPAVLDLSVSRLKEHAAAMAPLKRVNVTFGIADHILIGADYIVDLHRRGSEIIKAGNPEDKQHSAVFFTTSLVGKPSKVIAMMRDIRSRIGDEVQLIPLVVLDGRWIEEAKFGLLWKEMVLEAKALFGKVDLSTNLSVDSINVMSPAQLVKFAEENGFDEVTINWAPTLLNAPRTLSDNESMAKWLLEFDALAQAGAEQITTSFRPVIERTIDALMCTYDGTPPSLMSTVTDLVPETILKSIEIDHLGNLLPKFEAIGDITHADRHGMKNLGHIAQASIATLIDKAMPTVARKIATIHAKGTCATCKYSAVCAGTGFHIATNVARLSGVGLDNHGKCPHVAFGLIDRIAEEMMTRQKERGLLA
jgi:hypothetical protein